MENVSFHFIFSDSIQTLNIQSEDLHELEILEDFLNIFGRFDNGKWLLKTSYQIDEEIILKVENLKDHYFKQAPILHSMYELIKARKGEHFLLANKKIENSQESSQLMLYVQSLNESSSPEEAIAKYEEKSSEVEELFGSVIKNYELKNYGQSNEMRVKKKYIGLADKNLRVCRFCRRDMSQGASFKTTAHAIPEALGNKKFILNEECDECNRFFGSEIEPDLINKLSLLRVMLGLKGKRQIPNVKHKDGAYANEGGRLVIQAQEVKTPDENGNFRAEVTFNEKHTPVNFYKSLCKITLSLIEDSELEFLSETIEWIRSNKHSERELPEISSSIFYSGFTPSFRLTLYVRKESAPNDIPHVIGEFMLGPLCHVFILPFSKKDIIEYTGRLQDYTFWDLFKHYKQLDWDSHNYSSYEATEVREAINFIQTGKG